MNNQLNLRPLPSAGRWAVLGLSLCGNALAAEAHNPEQYKDELLAIEKRLDAKLKLLDEKLNRLEVLESKSAAITAAPAIAPPAPVETKPPVPTQTVETKDSDKMPSKKQEGFPVSSSYGKNGFEVKTDDGKFALAIQNRIQVRYANPFDSDPRSISDLERDQSSFMIRRARTKLKGHAYWPWLKYYMQYDWSQPVLRDLNLTLDKYNWAKLWVGRGKVVYNDERVTSSSNQQFVNRSIVNDIFTVDRQQGVQVLGNLFPGRWYDMSYVAGIFTGLGVGERNNDDDNMMYAGRLQWNALGGEMPFTQSDIEFHQKPALNFAFAAATNQSKCTAFETDSNSCRNLDGFKKGEDGQYKINQMMEEVRFKWQGLSIQHEMHWKEIEDTLKAESDSSRDTNLRGGLIQAGYFPHYLFAIVPKNLEFAGRYAFVDPNTDVDNDMQQEVSGVMTYFFSGHSNKVNFQVSHLIVEDPRSFMSQSEQRFWLQWDLSF
ncbi:MAG: porin [Methylicorpusculum sp.]|uniref:porin n=1 Tax=Methylicorpusculum sp. TaxID=2713644 RepID=UPI002726BBE3|nr:porin [Methylicorpusculum sp.]MDO8941029.1 porin [Methylicorpusculum sp.]MDP2203874.1 porin [Methylicorpusculum sp.]